MSRLFDILLSSLVIIFLSPLFLPLSLLLRFSGEGEVFYRQVRVGLRGESFYIYKFATMLKNSPNIGSGTLTMMNDPRILPLGNFLRKTKINELPQLLNILKGNMSFVGPRPLVPEGERNYTAEEKEIIRSVLPGATGIGSLVLRDEESYYAHLVDGKGFYTKVISPYKAKLEIWYVQNRSMGLDIRIIFSTVIAIIFPSWNPYDVFKDLPPIPQEMVESRLKLQKQ